MNAEHCNVQNCSSSTTANVSFNELPFTCRDFCKHGSVKKAKLVNVISYFKQFIISYFAISRFQNRGSA